MKEQVLFLNMFPDYAPPELLRSSFSQAAITAADIDPESRSVSVTLSSPAYIPQRHLDQVGNYNSSIRLINASSS